jgi:hypothetical protein
MFGVTPGFRQSCGHGGVGRVYAGNSSLSWSQNQCHMGKQVLGFSDLYMLPTARALEVYIN